MSDLIPFPSHAQARRRHESMSSQPARTGQMIPLEPKPAAPEMISRRHGGLSEHNPDLTPEEREIVRQWRILDTELDRTGRTPAHLDADGPEWRLCVRYWQLERHLAELRGERISTWFAEHPRIHLTRDTHATLCAYAERKGCTLDAAVRRLLGMRSAR
jgi:hypothetical protein